jgi:hypothetical protein
MRGGVVTGLFIAAVLLSGCVSYARYTYDEIKDYRDAGKDY